MLLSLEILVIKKQSYNSQFPAMTIFLISVVTCNLYNLPQMRYVVLRVLNVNNHESIFTNVSSSEVYCDNKIKKL